MQSYIWMFSGSVKWRARRQSPPGLCASFSRCFLLPLHL